MYTLLSPERPGLQRSLLLPLGMAGQDDSGEWVSLCCRYTGHCPLLRFSMGQTYGQVTGQLLRDPPGLAWPPVHRTLLPPIRPPRSPEVPRESLPLRHGHKRLSPSMIPGYTGLYTGMPRCPSQEHVFQTLMSLPCPRMPRFCTPGTVHLCQELQPGLGRGSE